MERSVEIIEEGGVNDHAITLPGRTKWSNIVLKSGMMDKRLLWDWYQEGLYDGKVKQIDFSIILRNVRGEEAKRWTVSKGFPVKWEGPSFNVESNQVAVETLEIAHQGLTLVKK